ncbi:hypothetical protein Tsubulata_031950 [Turnera subulata]|uniref:Protein SCAI n=1 Tax=Turnera subulata TaxID=218843 RepID=A0A9Q0FPP0_9ROSI|nr:hypothetical protein Tsubulata_031950 [Turnera subulata]
MTTEQQQQITSNSSSITSNIPVSEVYWSLVEKADKKFSKIRDLPYYERKRYDTYFYKVFKVYTQLWKFQQENRQKLVDSGLKRWEIGEIASRIAQLYYGQYMRTSDANYLSESYVFYEAILSREYFKDGSFQDLNLANKQLRFYARFLTDTDFREWKLVVQEIIRFLKADTAFMNIRPLRYSLVLDPYPDSLPRVATKRNLRLRDAVLSSYHHNEVKFSELTVETFRMLQCLEWEPSGSFYQPGNIKLGQNGGTGSNRVNNSQEITDPTLPPNPRKAVLYHPSVTHFLAVSKIFCLSFCYSIGCSSNLFVLLTRTVMGTICEELPLDGVLFVYLSASGRVGHTISSSSSAGNSINSADNALRNFQSFTIYSDAVPTSTFISPSNSANPSSRRSKGDCLHFGSRGLGGLNSIYPSDLVPFTRKPLFIVIDSDCSEAFKASVFLALCCLIQSCTCVHLMRIFGFHRIHRGAEQMNKSEYEKKLSHQSDCSESTANSVMGELGNHLFLRLGVYLQGRFWKGHDFPFYKVKNLTLMGCEINDLQSINGAEKGEPAAILLSPNCSTLIATESSRHHAGSLFTMFLTTPLQAFCLLIGLSVSDIQMNESQDTYNKAEKLLSSSMNDWGLTLDKLENLDPVWAQILGDPFLRRLLLRFVFCRAVLALYGVSFGKKEFHPECLPSLPPCVIPTCHTSQTVVLQMANIFGATKKFIFSDGILLPETET